MKDHLYTNKLYLASWLILPIIGIWLTTTYLLDSQVKADWDGVNQVAKHQSTSQAEQYLVKQPNFPEVTIKHDGAITFWFDDAWLSQYEFGAKTLKEFDFPAAIAVPSNYPDYGGYINWDQLRQLQANGWELTSHSVTHDCSEEAPSEEKIEYELHYSKQVLISEGLRAIHYVAPCGIKSEATKEIAEKYYKSFRTAEPGLNQLPTKDPYDLKVFSVEKKTTSKEVKDLIRQAKLSNSWLILMFHQIESGEAQYSVTPEFLREIAQETKNSEIQVLVPTQVLNAKYEN